MSTDNLLVGPPAQFEYFVIDEVEKYNQGVAGVDMRTVPDGPVVGSSKTATLTLPQLVFTTAKLGFSFCANSILPEGVVFVATVLDSPPGSKWCGFDLEAGTTLVYGPGAEHASHALGGLEFAYVAVPVNELTEVADQVQVELESIEHGSVAQLHSTPQVRSLVATMRELRAAAVNRLAPPALVPRIVPDMAMALARPDCRRSRAPTKRIDSRHVVLAAIQYAESIRRIPSLHELCLTAHVSERRLRSAFTEEFDLPPTVFFRMWALEKARCELLERSGQRHAVTTVAANLGFGHLGRFSQYYRDVYGETPSVTTRLQAGAMARSTRADT